MKWILTQITLLSLVLAASGFADTVPLDDNLVALFSDLHVTTQAGNPHQREGFSQCVNAVIACNPRPANALFFGDLAFQIGDPDDYRLLKALVKPLEDAGIHWHACFGNHDRRAAFFSVFPERQQASPPVTDRLITIVTTPHADFILLDSCLEGPVNGAIDDAQRAWLQTTLSHATKPVFVGAHHPLKETAIADLLAANACCKGYVFGHVHAWKQQRQQDVHTLSLPSTGHWGDIGYVLVKLSADEAVFTLNQRDYYTPRPAATPEEIQPKWLERVQKNAGSQWRVPLKAADSGLETPR